MKPIKFKECNVIYGEKQENYLPLPAYLEPGENGQVVTCWELSEEELARINETKKVYLSQLTFHSRLQPVYLTALKGDIFINQQEE